MLNRILASRVGYLIGFIFSFGLVALALYLQVRDNLEPCPLCIFQRIAFMSLGVLFLAAALHNSQGLWRRIHAMLQLATVAAGAGIAIRHIWIQNHADEVMAECGAGVEYLFEHFPLRKFLQLVFKGTGECSAIDWKLFGFTIPELSLTAFIGLGVYALILAFAKKA